MNYKFISPAKTEGTFLKVINVLNIFYVICFFPIKDKWLPRMTKDQAIRAILVQNNLAVPSKDCCQIYNLEFGTTPAQHFSNWTISNLSLNHFHFTIVKSQSLAKKLLNIELSASFQCLQELYYIGEQKGYTYNFLTILQCLIIENKFIIVK